MRTSGGMCNCYRACSPTTSLPQRLQLESSKTCPGCGGANSWVHPTIQAFLMTEFPDMPHFQYQNNSTAVAGIAEKKKTQVAGKVMHWGLGAMVISLPLFLISSALGSLFM